MAISRGYELAGVGESVTHLTRLHLDIGVSTLVNIEQ